MKLNIISFSLLLAGSILFSSCSHDHPKYRIVNKWALVSVENMDLLKESIQSPADAALYDRMAHDIPQITWKFNKDMSIEKKTRDSLLKACTYEISKNGKQLTTIDSGTEKLNTYLIIKLTADSLVITPEGNIIAMTMHFRVW